MVRRIRGLVYVSVSVKVSWAQNYFPTKLLISAWTAKDEIKWAEIYKVSFPRHRSTLGEVMTKL